MEDMGSVRSIVDIQWVQYSGMLHMIDVVKCVNQCPQIHFNPVTITFLLSFGRLLTRFS